MRYAIVIERGVTSYSAFVPDLPACISTGMVVSEVRDKIQAAMAAYAEELARAGKSLPPASPAPQPRPGEIIELIEIPASPR